MNLEEIVKQTFEKHAQNTSRKILIRAFKITKRNENEDALDTFRKFYKLFTQSLYQENIFDEKEFEKEFEKIHAEWLHSEFLKNEGEK
jgi:hypothetical protein